ncbi:MAG: 5'-3' exonuclease, partial [bacterium]
MAPKRILLVDGNSLLFRGYFILPEMRTAAGLPTNGLFGFLRMVLKAQQDWKPDGVVVALDKGRPFREAIDRNYKATRESTPEGLAPQLQLFESFVEALGMTPVGLEGFEADDIIGTLAESSADAVESLVLTGDRDLLQVLGPNTKILYVHRKGVSDLEIYDEAKFQNEYGFPSKSLPDYKALVGDTSDNIPGVPGIGEKTAKSLLQKYLTLEGILEHLSGLPPKTRTLLFESKERMFKSRDLATIRRDAELKSAAEPKLMDLSTSQARAMLEKLEFWSFLKAQKPKGAETETGGRAAEPSPEIRTVRVQEIITKARKGRR